MVAMGAPKCVHLSLSINAMGDLWQALTDAFQHVETGPTNQTNSATTIIKMMGMVALAAVLSKMATDACHRHNHTTFVSLALKTVPCVWRQVSANIATLDSLSWKVFAYQVARIDFAPKEAVALIALNNATNAQINLASVVLTTTSSRSTVNVTNIVRRVIMIDQTRCWAISASCAHHRVQGVLQLCALLVGIPIT